MKPRRWMLISVLLLLVIGGVWFALMPREPKWRGHTMSDWFETAIQEETASPQRIQGGKLLPSAGTARLAFQVFGTNAIPFLLEKLPYRPAPKLTKFQTWVVKYRSWLPKQVVSKLLPNRFPRDEQRAAAIMLTTIAIQHSEVADTLVQTLGTAKVVTPGPAGYVSLIQVTFNFVGGTTVVAPGDNILSAIVHTIGEGQFYHRDLAPALLHCTAISSSWLADEVEQAWNQTTVRQSLGESIPTFVAALNPSDPRLQNAAAIALGLWLLDLESNRSGYSSVKKADPARIARFKELIARHQIPDARLIEVLVESTITYQRLTAYPILGHLAHADDRVVENLIFRMSIASPGQIPRISMALSSLGLSAVPALPALMAYRETVETNSVPAASLAPPPMTLSPGTNLPPVVALQPSSTRDLAQATSNTRMTLLRAAYAAMNNLPEAATPKVRQAIAKATENWPQDLVRELVFRFSLEDLTAWSAMKELEKLGPAIVSAALPDLRAALKHPNDRVRAQAANTIAEAGPAAILALPELKILAESEAPNVRETIEKAIQKIEASVKH